MMSKPALFRPSLSFTVTILIAFTLIFTVILSVAVFGFRSTAEQAAIATADVSLAETASTVAARTNALVQPVLVLIREVATTGIGDRPANAQAGTKLLSVLSDEPEIRTVSAAWPDGTLLQAAPVGLVPAAAMPPLPSRAAYVLCFSRPGDAANSWLFLAADRSVISGAAFGRPADPRGTQWYLQARAPGVYVSTPYVLSLTRQVGLSVSCPLAGDGVIALDVTLGSLSDFLRAQQVTPHSTAFLFSDLGILLAHPDAARVVRAAVHGRVSWTTLQDSQDPVLEAVWYAYASSELLPGQSAQLDVDGIAMLARLEPVETLENPPVLVAVVAPRSDFTAPVDDAVRQGTLFALGAFMAGFGAIALMSWRIAKPLGVLTREAQAIRRLELTAPLNLRSRITEVERLTEAIAAMKATLTSFTVYLPRDLVHQFLAAGIEPRLGGERVALSVMFSDIQGFTTIAERLDPVELTNIASAYFEAVTRELLAAHGTIDKYIGDSVMAFWNAPRRDPLHAAHACTATLRARAVTLRLAGEFTARGWPALSTRFGVHTGEAVVGNVGSSDRMTYTAMGAMVNLANRMEGLNKLYGTQILVSEATRVAAGPGFVFRPADIVILKGSAMPMPVHELLGIADTTAAPALQAKESDLASLDAWEDCVAAYRNGDFAAARAALERVQRIGTFPLAAVYTQRLSTAGAKAAPGWSPLVRMDVK